MLSVNQYEKAIINSLSSRDIEVLALLYSSPNSSATAKALTKKISPTSDQHIIANRFIGKIGKAIAVYSSVKLNTYWDRDIKRPSYFTVVGPYSREKGWEMRKNLRTAMGNLENSGLLEDLINQLPTEESSVKQDIFEGTLKQVFVNKYERSSIARRKCIEYYGDKCFICKFDFGDVYGEKAKGFIQVHHKNPLSKIGKNYKVDPIKDLIPICPNCHSVVHLKREGFSSKEVNNMINKQKKIFKTR